MITTTTTTTTIAQQLAAAYPFTVDKLPLRGPDNMSTPHYGLFRDDNGQCVGQAVRNGYVPHTLDDVAAVAEAAAVALGGEGNYELETGWRDGHRLTIRPTKNYRRTIREENRDAVWPTLTIDAPYDGNALKTRLLLYRDACSNLQMIRPTGAGVTATIRHTQGMRDRLDELVDTLGRLARRWEDVVDAVRTMQRKEVSLREFIEACYPLPEEPTDRMLRARERTFEQITRRYDRERRQFDRFGKLHTAWDAYNAVQGYVQHDQRRLGSPSRINRAFLALDAAPVRRAHDLALAS